MPHTQGFGVHSITQPILYTLLIYVHYSYNTHTLVADILDRVSAKFCELELEYDCLVGGRIDHKKDEKSILVYGYSMVSEMLRPYNGVLVFATLQQGFGRADHSETVKLLKEHYPEYGDQITFRNEGY